MSDCSIIDLSLYDRVVLDDYESQWLRDHDAVACERVDALVESRYAGVRGGGLSTAHISPAAAKLLIYVPGGLVEYIRPVVPEEREGGAERGIITAFTRAARLRMMRMLAKVDRNKVPVFVTLTYPDEFPEDKEKWARDLDTFRKAIVRRWPTASAIWRKEFKKRRTGKNQGQFAPHFHLLVWGVTYYDLRAWCADTWYRIVGSGDLKHLMAGTRVEKLRDYRGARSYASKYIGKEQEISECFPDGCGRLWGVINRPLIPWAQVLELDVDQLEAMEFLRAARRYMGSRLVRVADGTKEQFVRVKVPDRVWRHGAEGDWNAHIQMLCNVPERWFDLIDAKVN